jgi:hypothetical protein
VLILLILDCRGLADVLLIFVTSPPGCPAEQG